MIEPSLGDYIGMAFLCLVAAGIGLAFASALIAIWKMVASILQEIRAEKARRQRS